VENRTVLPAPDQTLLEGTPPRTAICAVVESPKNTVFSKSAACAPIQKEQTASEITDIKSKIFFKA
jgi:hypothetical protein